MPRQIHQVRSIRKVAIGRSAAGWLARGLAPILDQLAELEGHVTGFDATELRGFVALVQRLTALFHHLCQRFPRLRIRRRGHVNACPAQCLVHLFQCCRNALRIRIAATLCKSWRAATHFVVKKFE